MLKAAEGLSVLTLSLPKINRVLELLEDGFSMIWPPFTSMLDLLK